MATLSTSNSYATYAQYAEYMDLSGGTALEQSTIEPFLIQATLAIDRKYGGRFLGRKASPTQPLAWPRVGVPEKSIDLPEGFYSVDADGNYRDFNITPVEVIQATCETANNLLNGDTISVQDTPVVTEETVKVDVIQTTTKYAVNYQSKTAQSYTCDLILRPLLMPAATTVKFVV